MSLYITKKISKPLEELQESTEKLEKGDFKTRVSIKTKDEFGQLGHAFNKTAEALGKMDKFRVDTDDLAPIIHKGPH